MKHVTGTKEIIPPVQNFMPSTKNQKAKTKKSREMNILSEYGNMDVMLKERNSNSLERELDNVLNRREGHQDSASVPNREGSFQENEIRNRYNGNDTTFRDRLTESIDISSGEMNARLSQEIDSLMETIQTQINRMFISAINDRVLPEKKRKLWEVCFWTKMVLARVWMPQNRFVLVMRGRIQTLQKQRRTHSPHVILGKTRTEPLTW